MFKTVSICSMVIIAGLTFAAGVYMHHPRITQKVEYFRGYWVTTKLYTHEFSVMWDASHSTLTDNPAELDSLCADGRAKMMEADSLLKKYNK